MPQLKIHNAETFNESEEFVSLDGERHYLIRDIDSLSPFFVSLASRDDHWLFISSTTGLTAGRVAPEFALFPYLPVDKIHESNQHTGALTYLKVGTGGQSQLWAPFFIEVLGKVNAVETFIKTCSVLEFASRKRVTT